MAPVVDELDFSLKHGDLLAVIGPVGSGKSTLLATLLQENTKLKGVLEIGGTIAFMSQEPFILSDTVRANILLEKELN